MARLSPLMEQYFRIKEQCPDALLLFRMGDFYETFGEDAITASRTLNITLTSRQRDDEGNRIPLAGIPYHSLDVYLSRLVNAGHKVAICEQVEDPKHAKGIVRREITRIVTPGTVIEPALLQEKSNNYLAAVLPENGLAGLALLDLSTGDFIASEVSVERLRSELARFSPAECLAPPGTSLDGMRVQHLDVDLFSMNDASVGGILGDLYDRNPLCARAACAIISYLRETRIRSLDHIKPIRMVSSSEYMLLDDITLRNLEIFRNLRDGSRSGTLMEILDETVTPMGSRTLARWLQMPSMSLEVIRRRQDAVEEMVRRAVIREEISELLEGLSDLERIIGRVSLGSAGPKDLMALRASLRRIPEISQAMSGLESDYLADIRKRLDLNELGDLVGLLERALSDDPPSSPKDGGVIRDGYSPELDELRAALRSGRSWIAELESSERKRTGIKSLKVGYNNVFGYYIEVTKPNLPMVPGDYVRKQTLSSAERFVTQELKEMESRVLSAQERSSALEYELFIDLRRQVASRTRAVQEVAAAIGELDTILGLTKAALRGAMVRPLVDAGREMVLRNSRHPVLDRAMKGSFVPNDLTMDESSWFMILTGPNMAGKSTFMRQVALIVIMAQIGSFVPASYAKIGLVDRIFTRVGARDDLVSGRSTFMVEMSELANILVSATEGSLILLDEIGRGTSTFDGLSIAWAVSEYIHSRIRAKTIFATHYHQLTQLNLPGIVNCSMAVKEEGKSITFLRTVVPGATNKSYGIHVARLAGVPEQVIRRAEELLDIIEEQAAIEIRKCRSGDRPKRYTQLIFFSQPETPDSAILEEIRNLQPEKITPLQALNLLVEYRRRLGCKDVQDTHTR
ncbi:MAG: DNA mismatch repair protein MutS [Methanothrix sp.]|jgi:DNA mismatch repair protein MutS|uniref:DNA mismatch repair protein MutS n=1 Tax=Methanothrix sp. TaxID=90426 RepID=UPI00247BA2FE|nr:DNA mismatch repair protein MutS [Methanothrix sp.]